ncbi:diguanylate cyclase [Acanthopleuribacter pedis]|uniref:diguanylate cyclase n=1 Tax=Acanthopleuribacter pedis TaxID=442870 RepID=A0A8J7U8M8_9BACT|nr:diguanylate cyclase [Acanthopleuribacter pedis]MBO1322731.1 diguanylate cyclase [Acanthopleuribacter pedis]
MDAKQEKFMQKLGKLRDSYSKELPGRIDGIRELVDVLKNHPSDQANLKELIRRIHCFSGSAVYFGYKQLNFVAREFELILTDWQEQGLPLKQEALTRLEHYFDRLVEASQRPLDHQPTTVIEPKPIEDPVLPNADAGRKQIILVQADRADRCEWELQLTFYGFRVFSFENLQRLRDFEKENPIQASLLILDLDEILAAQQDIGLRQFVLQQNHQAPIVYVSTREDLHARLEAVRLGGDGFLNRPLELNDLVDVVDKAVRNTQQDPYRVLLVEDDPRMAEHFTHVLQAAGFVVETVVDPFQLLDRMGASDPELILLDYHLPHCNGIELAKVVRQQPRYLSMPIIFLSTEENIERHYNALNAGADDFLSKPISPRTLVISLQARLARTRALKSLMAHDSLTGLLNHVTLKEKLSINAARADRTSKPLCFAMIDIDHFKKVNDTYGHAVGDRVLQSMSRVLKQRLRRSDVIGRYGGEEFGLILFDTPLEAAYEVIDEIRRNFSKVTHVADGVHFHVTFSGGIAVFDDFPAPGAVMEAADRALYLAKRQGRNRIVKAPPSILAGE